MTSSALPCLSLQGFSGLDGAKGDSGPAGPKVHVLSFSVHRNPVLFLLFHTYCLCDNAKISIRLGVDVKVYTAVALFSAVLILQ